MNRNFLSAALCAALVTTGVAFWAPHLAEKVAAIVAPAPKLADGEIEIPAIVVGTTHDATIAPIFVKLKALEDAIGINLLGLPERDGALIFEKMPPKTQFAFLTAARATMPYFAVAEGAVIVLFLVALAGLLQRGVRVGLRATLVAYIAGLALAAAIMSAHVFGGLRPNLPAQMGFVGMHMLGTCAALAGLSKLSARSSWHALPGTGVNRRVELPSRTAALFPFPNRSQS